MRPKRLIASSTAALAFDSSATSNCTNAMFSCATSGKTLRAFSRFLPVATTRSPERNAALAIPVPMPLPAPVINQTLLMVFCGLLIRLWHPLHDIEQSANTTLWFWQRHQLRCQCIKPFVSVETGCVVVEV